jgi:acyl-CoA synthetase (NDP forming)
VDTISELFDAAIAFDFQPLPTGRCAVIITNAGGPAALASDSLSSNGFTLEDLEEKTKDNLRSFLNPSAQVGNPVDMLGGAEAKEYGLAVAALLEDKNVDIVLPILVPQALVNPAEIAQSIVDASRGAHKPVLTCFMGDVSVGEGRQVLQGNRMPMYTTPETMGEVLNAMLRYADWRKKPLPRVPSLNKVDRAAARKILNQSKDGHTLGEAATRPLLAAYGIPVVKGGVAHNPYESASVAAQVGFPVAMKIISPQILHKSDVGGIRLNLETEIDVANEYERLFMDLQRKLPQAKLEGVLIEQMAPRGQEVIVGMRRDPGFGPLVMFGLGGIYVELFKDVSFRVAPVSEQDALEMIHETQAGRLLTGFRGQPKADLKAVVDCICRLGQLALDFPEIEEAEVNPLLVFAKGEGALALDGRVITR